MNNVINNIFIPKTLFFEGKNITGNKFVLVAVTENVLLDEY